MAPHRSLPQGTDSTVDRQLTCLVDNNSDFCCCVQALGVASKHPLPKLRSWRFTPVFSSKDSIDLALTLGPLIHSGYIFVHAVRTRIVCGQGGSFHWMALGHHTNFKISLISMKKSAGILIGIVFNLWCSLGSSAMIIMLSSDTNMGCFQLFRSF